MSESHLLINQQSNIDSGTFTAPLESLFNDSDKSLKASLEENLNCSPGLDSIINLDSYGYDYDYCIVLPFSVNDSEEDRVKSNF